MTKVGWYEDETVDAIDVDTDAIIAELAVIEGKVDTVDGVVDTINTKVDTVDAVVDAIKPSTDKIDSATTLGLLGTNNSLSYRVHEIERHLHGRERWLGKKAVQTATDWADDVLSPFRAISGNNTYGSDANDEALVLGTDDTPVIANMAKFDMHEMFVVAASSATIYKLRVIYGTGTMADAITAGQFSETMAMIDAATGQVPHGPVPVMMPRGTCGSTKVWVQAWNATNNATIDFVVGLHEYEG